MTNRINGDFDQDSMEAFRAAYAAQLLEPEDQEIDAHTGLPSNVVLNTSPWIQHTGLWKANPGNLNDFVPNQVLSAPETESEIDEISDEEIDNLVNELLSSELDDDFLIDDSYLEDDEDEELEALIDELLSEGNEDGLYLEEPEEVELSEEDIDELIDSLQQEIDMDLE